MCPTYTYQFKVKYNGIVLKVFQYGTTPASISIPYHRCRSKNIHTVPLLYTKQVTGPFTNSHHWSVPVSKETSEKQLAHKSVPNEIFYSGHTSSQRRCLWGLPEDKGSQEPRRADDIHHHTSSFLCLNLILNPIPREWLFSTDLLQWWSHKLRWIKQLIN